MMPLQYCFLIVLIKTYVVGTRLNCLDLLRQQVEAIQMSSHNICFYKELYKSTLTVRLLNCFTVRL